MTRKELYNSYLNDDDFNMLVRWKEPYDFTKIKEYFYDVHFNVDDSKNMTHKDICNEFQRWLENPNKVKSSRNLYRKEKIERLLEDDEKRNRDNIR